MIASLVKYCIVGMATLVVLGLAVALVGLVAGVAFALAKFLLVVIVPALLVGYVVVRFVAPRRERLAETERRSPSGV